MKKWIQNFALAVGSVILISIFFEFIILKYLIPTTNIPRYEFKEGMIKYKANQKGTMLLANEYFSEFSINENGWNSNHTNYSIKNNSKKRIAFIGDSYIAGIEAGYQNSIPFLLESALGPDRYEVYNFGLMGSHLAHYLFVFKNEVLKYNPTLVIFQLAHNDFAPSYIKDTNYFYGLKGQFFSTFLIKNNNQIEIIPPEPYKSSQDRLLDFRLIRFLFFQYKLMGKYYYLKSLLLNKEYQMNIDPNSIQDYVESKNNKIAAEYLVSKVLSIAKEKSIKILFVMNGDTQSIYKGGNGQTERAPLKLNRMMAGILKNKGQKLIDLHETFKMDYKENQKKFEFKTDAHWSPHGHKVAAQPIIRATRKVLINQ